MDKEIRGYPVTTYEPSKAHVNILPTSYHAVDVEALNILWGMLGVQTDGFS